MAKDKQARGAALAEVVFVNGKWCLTVGGYFLGVEAGVCPDVRFPNPLWDYEMLHEAASQINFAVENGFDGAGDTLRGDRPQ